MPMNEMPKRFPVECPDAQTKYDGNRVLFRVEVDGRLAGVLGKFIVRQLDEFLFVDVECTDSSLSIRASQYSRVFLSPLASAR